MDLHLTDKVILVTGGERGIGAAIVRGFAAEGAIPIIVGRATEAGQALESELLSLGYRTLFVQAELSEESACTNAVESALAAFGRIDCLVNNAGVNDSVGLEHGSRERFIQSLHANLVHYYLMAHYALEALKATKGTILNISSKTAVTGQGGTSGYVAAKGGILGLTREWAVELLKYGIRVNSVVPAEVMTPLYENWIQQFDDSQAKLDQITARIPLESRMTTAEEIANTAIFLASDRSAHTTGQILFVDGGYVHLDRSINTLEQ